MITFSSILLVALENPGVSSNHQDPYIQKMAEKCEKANIQDVSKFIRDNHSYLKQKQQTMLNAEFIRLKETFQKGKNDYISAKRKQLPQAEKDRIRNVTIGECKNVIKKMNLLVLRNLPSAVMNKVKEGITFGPAVASTMTEEFIAQKVFGEEE